MRRIFVFGSNLAGYHAGGSAHAAYAEHGAVWGCGIGLQGDSYAIPTKDEFIQTMSLDRIAIHVKNFLRFAEENSDMFFHVVAIGCGLAGFTPNQIAPLFTGAKANVGLPPEFNAILKRD